MTSTNRREILGRLAVASAASALAAPTLAQSTAHPDAELLAAWEEWLAAYRGCYAGRISDETYEAAMERIDALLLTLPAHTPAGIAVKLKVAFHDLGENLIVDSQDFMVRGEPNAGMLVDQRHRMVWGAVEDLQRLGGRLPS